MNVLDVENLKRIVNGTWIVPPQSGASPLTMTGVGIDSRADLAGKAFFALRGDQHDGHDFLHAASDAGAGLLVVAHDAASVDRPSGVPVLCVDCTRQALGRLAHAHRQSLKKTKVIAVTGSAGKTTTKRLIHCMLSQTLRGTCAPRSFNNDIGVPLTLLDAQPDDDFVVVEVGTNAPGEIASLAAIVEPDVAVITNVGRAHLEGLGSLAGVAKEKASIVSHLRPTGMAIVNADCSLLHRQLAACERVMRFGESEAADLRLTGRGLVESTQGDGNDSRMQSLFWFEVNGQQRYEFALPGRHNAMNALAAIAVAQRMGLSRAEIQAGLLNVDSEPMRMERVRINNIDIYNDAYNANPDSVVASLQSFMELTVDAPRRVIVLGDMLELGEAGPELHREVGRFLLELRTQHPIDQIILVGNLVAHLAHEVEDAFPSERLTCVSALNHDTKDKIIQRLAPGDAVLLKGSRRIGLEQIVGRLRLHGDRGRLKASETSHGPALRFGPA